jgi:hypothetical protein
MVNLSYPSAGGRMARAPIVRGNDTHTGISKERNHIAPLPASLRKSVEESDCAFSFAGCHVVKPQPRLYVSNRMGNIFFAVTTLRELPTPEN